MAQNLGAQDTTKQLQYEQPGEEQERGSTLEEVTRRQALLETQLDMLQRQHEITVDFVRRIHKEGNIRHSAVNQQMFILQEQIFGQPPSYAEASAIRQNAVQSTLEDVKQEPFLRKRYYSVHDRLATMWRIVSRLSRAPVQPGYERLEWECSCGELLYGDYKEAIPGSLKDFAALLHSHANRQPSRDTSPRAGASTHSRPTRMMQGWRLPEQRRSNDQPDDPTAEDRTGFSSRTHASPRRFLQICVENGRFTPLTLGELDVEQSHSDGQIFERLRRKYESIRQSSLPIRCRFRKPCRAIFVKARVTFPASVDDDTDYLSQFRLAKRPFVSPLEGTLNVPCIPPEREVTSGNYQYIPCPIDEPPIDNRTFFHHFYSPAWKHPGQLWHHRLPWKIGRSLTPTVQGVQMPHGWGIYLEEEPDWPLFMALMCLLLLLSGLVSGIYCWRTGDNQTGIAIGTWLTTIQATGATALFFWWT